MKSASSETRGRDGTAWDAQRRLASRPLVLVVDDEIMILRVLKVGLTRCGFDIVTESNPVSALELVRAATRELHALVTDLQMPHMSGFHLAQHVRQLAPSLRIILHTGAATTPACDGIIDAIVYKPAAIETVAGALSTVLALP